MKQENPEKDKRIRKIKRARSALKTLMFFPLPIMIIVSFLQGSWSESNVDWLEDLYLILEASGMLMLIVYLAIISFAKNHILAQIYILLFCICVGMMGFPIFTIFTILIAMGQIAWYKNNQES